MGRDYTCNLCKKKMSTIQLYLLHCRRHSGLPSRTLKCGVQNCLKKFSHYRSLACHVSQSHKRHRKEELQRGMQAVAIPVVCPVVLCQKKCKDSKELFSHFQEHFSHDQAVDCPFSKCNGIFRSRTSFKMHVSRYHRDWQHSDMKEICFENEPVGQETSCSLDHHSDDSDADVGLEGNNDPDVEEMRSEIISKDDFMKSLAMFYMLLQHKLLLPSSTVQTIADEVLNLVELNRSFSSVAVADGLKGIPGIDESVIRDVVSILNQNDLFKQCHGPDGEFRSEHLRNKYCRQHFKFVQPRQMKLVKGFESSRYHYVPIAQSLEALVSDETVEKQFLNPIQQTPGVLNDYTDGHLISMSNVTVGNAIDLILFQDSFEPANPLGAAKSKHKVLAVYCTLGNLYSFNRSKVDHIQLAILCKEKDLKTFGPSQIFGELVKDLKHLETEGITMNGTKYPVILRAICGDNLGSHNIGGFIQNFSNAEHFCRFCPVSRTEWKKDSLAKKPLRTVADYQRALDQLGEDGAESSVLGIQEDSVFNQLSNFHVCGALPPCLAHDLFEGVVNYDVALMLNYFSKSSEKFSFKHLELILKKKTPFKYGATDRSSPACVPTSKKLGGTASQNWCLLRLLPIMIMDLIEDKQDPVWKLLLLLREFVELVTANSLTEGQVSYMNTVVEEYVHSRKGLFPDVNLRPKHHYIVHYPSLTLQYGPLIRLWTLRFESKHQFFKRTVRRTQNFKNITGTLADRHQYLQALCSGSSRFPGDLIIAGGVPFNPVILNEKIVEPVRSCGYHTEGRTHVSESIIVRGTTYKRGMFVIVARDSSSPKNLIFGEIVLTLADDIAHFVVMERNGEFDPQTGLYCLNPASNDWHCVGHCNLMDFNPLSSYRIEACEYIALKCEPCDIK